jgi:hypothetical protein
VNVGQDNPIPGVFNLIRKVFEPLARDAGCFVALNEYSWSVNGETLSAAPLQALPLCLRYGCNDMASLGWFRFGYRQRISAHALASSFPPPQEMTEVELSKWIRSTMSKWVAGEIAVSDERRTLLDHARTVVLHAAD